MTDDLNREDDFEHEFDEDEGGISPALVEYAIILSIIATATIVVLGVLVGIPVMLAKRLFGRKEKSLSERAMAAVSEHLPG